MKATRDVVRDLLPLYAAGEASPDSRALVEEFLRDDPELARLAESLRAEEPGVAPAPRPAGAGLAALQETRALLRRRTWLMALALFFTGLPLSFVFDSGRFTFLLIRDAPWAGAASLALGAALWIAFAVTARRLRVTGL
jgi:anti-sigma factor RsiW